MCKLKYEDLKKGSIIYFPFIKENVEVIGINALTGHDFPYFNKLSVVQGKNIYYEQINVFRPIPLSIDWLKKVGYKQLKRIEKTYSIGNFEDNSSIYFSGVRFIHIQTGTHLEYLHELQNLHSCLFKKELKFQP